MDKQRIVRAMVAFAATLVVVLNAPVALKVPFYGFAFFSAPLGMLLAMCGPATAALPVLLAVLIWATERRFGTSGPPAPVLAQAAVAVAVGWAAGWLFGVPAEMLALSAAGAVPIA